MTTTTPRIPSALTIAGSDSCGGAGMQADLKTFTVLGVYGTSVITAITAQNTLGVHAAMQLPLELVQQQFDAVTSDIMPQAIKTGMLASVEMIELVAGMISDLQCPYVCDPVMVSKSGHSLIAPEAIATIRQRLFPLARIITPNRFEVQQLLGRSIGNVEQAAEAARELADMGPKAVVIKGIEKGTAMVDLVLHEGQLHTLRGDRYPSGKSHGSGCTFSAAITAELAKGADVPSACQSARKLIDVAIRESFSSCRGVHPVNVLAYRH